MPAKSWSGPRRRNWARASIQRRGSWWKPPSGYMRREWRQPYDPLPGPPRCSRFADAVWRFCSDVSAVPDCARRFPERDQGEYADIAGDDCHAARAIRAGPTVACALLAVAEIIRAGRLWLLIRVQHSGVHAAVAPGAQYFALKHSGAPNFMAHRCAAGRSCGGMEKPLG